MKTGRVVHSDLKPFLKPVFVISNIHAAKVRRGAADSGPVVIRVAFGRDRRAAGSGDHASDWASKPIEE